MLRVYANDKKIKKKTCMHMDHTYTLPQDRSSKVRAHMERISLSVKTEEVAARLKGER